MAPSSVDAVVAELTLSEKLRLVRGRADPDGRATGYLPGVERVGIPPLGLVDGPLGVRDGVSTALPATIALGASWDPALARRFGATLAAETRLKGHDVVLAPGVNVVRVPTCGRTFEYYGEDPRLTARMGAACVSGIEDAGVAATVKHFVANNQERDRNRVDARVDERTLHEIYLPAFHAAVEADVSAVMTAYNRVNGTYMSEHRDLLAGVLREEWDFSGVVMSDWWGTHDAVAAAMGGLDLEMPGVSPVERFPTDSAALRALRALVGAGVSERLGVDPPLLWQVLDRVDIDEGQPDPYPYDFFGAALSRAVDVGAVDEQVVDAKVRRVLRLYERLDLLDGERSAGAVDWDAHHDFARELARRGTVLLDNDGALPLSGHERVAVLGPNADEAKVGGGGSAEVTPTRTVSPVTGLRGRARSVRFERGVDRVPEPPMFDTPLSGWRPSGDDSELGAAVSAAAAADVAVVVVQDAATEGQDRDSLGLPGRQDRLVAAVADASPRTVVVVRASGPVMLPWVDDVAATLVTWYPGQADGVALADVVYGADPGGRLPVTFGRSFADYPVADRHRYPGVDGRARYDEGVFVGYRGFDRDGVDPLFPFGHGRSYADVGYSDLAVEREGGDCAGPDALDVSVTVENTTDRPGHEVVQAYVESPAEPVERPPRELGGFAPVELDGGQRRRVSLSVPRRALARYDPDEGWTVDAGEYAVAVGRSSRDERCRARVDVD